MWFQSSKRNLKKSISKGIADYVKNEYRYITYIFNGVQIANTVVPELQIPDLHQIIKVLNLPELVQEILAETEAMHKMYE